MCDNSNCLCHEALESLKTSPYHLMPKEDGSIDIWFRKNNKDIVALNLDRDNAYKFAFELLRPYRYNPKPENFNVSLCKPQ